MDWLTWALGLMVCAYTLALALKSFVPLLRYRRAKERTIRVDGVVVSYYGEDEINKGKDKVQTHYPIYQCVIDGEEKTLSGLVRKIGSGESGIGKSAILLYDKKTGELWCEKDLPEMWENTKARVIIIVAILVIMTMTSLILNI